MKTIDPTKPILGYALKKRIGSGGYGEVWAAEAPGGFPKAVKIVFGYHDERRAQTELKALNRIRDVRHPFLLSLERIDIVEGQMIVISELADMCLKTRFEECVESGLKGIPRSELLQYLRDASSALDFISDEFRLQHLDIKPENMLLVSGHIKVADFGLVKDIHDGTQSLMAGLTPAYAPPELFDGKPSSASDQYSLAILFQEMLTGKRPFDGVTAAQLAGQHLKERPDLKSLPREDQAVIARALSKDPLARYPSCSAMIAELSSDKTGTAAPSRRSRTKLREGNSRRRRNGIASATVTAMTRPFAASESTERKLEPIDCDATQSVVRPTLYLGVGQTGTRILSLMRRRLNQRYGDRETMPALRFLSLDTDSQELWRACRRGSDDGLLPEEVFETPLRRPEEYRTDARMHLAWLSRRWIYNIPKSLRTEGIRPLGRLALATHIESLSVRLRQVLTELVDAESLNLTAKTLGLHPSSQPRVVMVGSISGGTCSGMAIDLAYMVRAILQQLGAEHQDVIGFFSHSSNAQHRQRELATANALAFLNELYHFSCVEEYPGDVSCGIPANMDGTTTFSNTYLMHLGDNLDEDEYDTELDGLAEYLYLSTASPCTGYFDQFRRNEPETTGLPLRTIGISRSGAKLNDTINNAAGLLRRNMVDYWTDTEGDFDADVHVDELLARHSLNIPAMAKLTQEVIKSVLNQPLATVSKAFAGVLDLEDRSNLHARLKQVADSHFKPGETDEDSPVLVVAMQAVTKELTNETSERIHSDLLDMIDVPGRRMAGTMLVANALKQRLQKQLDDLHRFVRESEARLESQYNTIEDDSKLNASTRADFCKKLASEYLKRFGLISVHKILTAILPSCDDAVQAADTFRSEITWDKPAPIEKKKEEGMTQADVFDRLVFERLREQIPTLLSRVDQILQVNLLGDVGLRNAISDTYQRDAFHNELERATKMTILERLKEMSLKGMFGDEDLVERISLWMFQDATPALLCCGGGTRWMHAYPKNDKPVDTLVEAFQRHYEQRPTLIPATIGEVVSCIELEGLPLDNVAMHLLQNRTDSLEYASRLHTRTDISWTGISTMR